MVKSNDVLFEYDELCNLEIIDDKSSWFSYFEFVFDVAREVMDVVKMWGGFMCCDDILIVVVDFYVLSCVEYVL